MDVPMLVPRILSELFAVVLDSHYGGSTRVKLDPDGRSWLRSSPYGRGFQIQDSAPRDNPYLDPLHYPDTEHVEAATAIATALKGRGYCDRCGTADLGFHIVTPGVYDELWLGCVLRPDPRIVDSSGGGGDKKHYGDSAGCQSVEPANVYREDVYSPAGHYLHGEPLTAIEVINRDWCSRCTGTAHNVREHVRTHLAETLGRDATEDELADTIREREAHHLDGSRIRYVLDEIGDRKRNDLLIDLRAGLHWQSRDEYLATAKEHGWVP